MFDIKMTATGVDGQTHHYTKVMAEALAPLPSQVEYGFLYSATAVGNRYMPIFDLYEQMEQMASAGYEQMALHVCGSVAREQLILGRIKNLTKYARRIQVNGKVNHTELMAIATMYPGHEIITQHTEANKDLVNISVPNQNHSILVDGSCGRGRLPDMWDAPTTSKRVGFAGGLGPENLYTQLKEIAVQTKMRDFWIDMETGVRTKDWFDANKVTEAWLRVVEFLGDQEWYATLT